MNKMKNIRRIAVVVLALLFCAAAAVCTGVIFAVRNVNLTYVNYSDVYNENYAAIKNQLDGFKGYNIFSVSEEEVLEIINRNDSDHYFETVTFDKVYPCTVNITIKERVERFAVMRESAYDVYDSDGVFIRTSSENKNNVDQSPNILIAGSAVNDQNIEIVSGSCAYLNEQIGRIRSVLSEVEFKNESDEEYATLVYKLRSGLQIEIVKYDNLLADKLVKAVERFEQLNDSQKLKGKIRVYELTGSSNELRSIYTQA